MRKFVLYPVGTGKSCGFAAAFLERSGFTLTDHPSPDVTHLLLDVPSHNKDSVKELMRMLPKDVTVIGGNLDLPGDCKTTDLLKDPLFLAKNAAITAECALRAAVPYLEMTFADCNVLILGWGRIGKCLGKLLSGMGCSVTIAARKESDRAMAEALGHRAVDFSDLDQEARKHRLVFNTVPAGISLNASGCVVMDLASLPGLQGCGIIPARGLPGKYAPESAGKLIAETVCRLSKEGMS